MSRPVLVRPFSLRRFLVLLLFLFIIVLLLLSVTGVISIRELWNLVLLEPMLNFLILLSRYLLHNFGLSIIVFTIILRVLIYPITAHQLRTSREMQLLRPKLKELQSKYGKEPKKLRQEQWKIYREHRVAPYGCVLPLLLQLPIWIALYQSIIQSMAYTPENLLGLSKNLYNWSTIRDVVPLNHHFLWLDLTRGGIVTALLVAASMWVLQKMSTLPSADAQQQTMRRVWLWIIPLLFGFFALTLPSGLSLYWVTSNLIGILIQYRVTGWGTLKTLSLPFLGKKAQQTVDTLAKNEGKSGKKEKPKGDVDPLDFMH